jgi:tyrosinase
MATYTRTNAWNKGGTFDNLDLLWYAKGVGKMQERPLDDPSSWWFFAAIHGEYVTPESLRQRGAFPWGKIPGPPSVPTTPLPPKKTYELFWDQCQHGSWYFPPWHRGYLLALEAQIRSEVIKLGGPHSWALPYWNYFGSDPEYDIPPAFTSPTLPNGGTNPLLLTARYGPDHSTNQTDIWVATAAGIANHPSLPPGFFYGPVTLDSMNNHIYAGDDRIPEFGGPQTGFHHSDGTHGDLESNPHDLVHVYVGGRSPDGTIPGVMSVPALAGLDPVFYLHHANIDRLWAVWNAAPVKPPNVNPTDPAWLNGPAAAGGREFIMPRPDGKTWVYTPEEMTSLAQLDYTYDDLKPTPAVNILAQRLTLLGAASAALKVERGVTVAQGKNVDLVGASQAPLAIKASRAHTIVKLDPKVHRSLTASLDQASETAPPDRVILNLENVRGVHDAHVLSVFLNLPPGAKPGDHPELLAGSVALFGLGEASSDSGAHGGRGLNFALDISKVVDSLHLNKALTGDDIDVTIVPNRPVPDEAQITVGRISIYRQRR